MRKIGDRDGQHTSSGGHNLNIFAFSCAHPNPTHLTENICLKDMMCGKSPQIQIQEAVTRF